MIMKICLSSRVSLSYLKMADQIRIAYRDKKIITQYIVEYPQKEFIIEFPTPLTEEDINFLSKLQPYKNIYISLGFFPDHARLGKLKWFMGYPISSWDEAQATIKAGASYIYPSGALFFSLDELKRQNIPCRLVPNRAHRSLIPRETAETGEYLRPEDLHYYYTISPVIEFENIEPSAEEALYRIYFEEESFSGPIDFIIQDIGVNTPNRLIPNSWCEARLNCGQKCKLGSNCRICPNIFNLAEKVAVNHQPLSDYDPRN